ncbi:malate dehydrogenase [Candidatus Omnitrophota bacterium]
MINKITIVGAGNVGATTAFLILSRKLCRTLAVVDVQKDLAKGVALDLEDSRFVFGADIKIEASADLSAVAGSDIVIITAGRPRSPGMSRQDLIKINSSIVRHVCTALKRKAKKAIVIVVSNPLDITTYVAFRTTGFPRRQIIGMGSSLDSARLANLLSKKILVSIEDIDPAVFGAHGKDMLASRMTTVKGFALGSFLSSADFAKIKKATVERGATIVGLLKKGSARFAPAAACLDLIEAIDQDKKRLTFAAVYCKGEYGLKGICLGLPVIVGSRGVEKIVRLSLSAPERAVLKKAAKAVKKSISQL